MISRSSPQPKDALSAAAEVKIAVPSSASAGMKAPEWQAEITINAPLPHPPSLPADDTICREHMLCPLSATNLLTLPEVQARGRRFERRGLVEAGVV